MSEITWDDLVDNVARALARRAETSCRHIWPDPADPDWRDLARAAIGAMPLQPRQSENKELRARITVLERDRRERIATACLAGLLADPDVGATPDQITNFSIQHADILIAKLDRRAKP